MRSEGVICNTILTMLGKLSSDGVLGGLRGKAPVWNILLHCINMGHYYWANKEAERQIAGQIEVNSDLQGKKREHEEEWSLGNGKQMQTEARLTQNVERRQQRVKKSLG